MTSPKNYKIKEIFYTLQGEGAQVGQPAIFCRFSGCNLWSGSEKDRNTAACRFCDTDFVGMDGTLGGRYTASELIAIFQQLSPPNTLPIIVFTGGEPLLQLDDALVQACKIAGLRIAVETNGTQLPPDGIDWICLSPKPRSKQVLTRASELKLVFPQPETDMAPHNFEHYEVEHFFLQPMDGPHLQQNTAAAIAYCQANPKWRLSVQVHKLIGLR